jgi:hypothetical protein
MNSLGTRGEEQAWMPNYKLPNVNELWKGVTFLDNDFFGPLYPSWVLVLTSRQSSGERGCQDIKRLFHQRACIRLESAQQRHVYLQDYFRRSVVRLDETADIDISTLLALRILALEVIPSELDELFTMPACQLRSTFGSCTNCKCMYGRPILVIKLPTQQRGRARAQ